MAGILAWLTALVFGAAAIGALSTGKIAPTIFALIVAVAAFPPLWNDSRFGLSNTPRGVRWGAGIVCLLLFMGSLAASNAPTGTQPAIANPAPAAASTTQTNTATQVAATAPPESKPTDVPATPANWLYDSSFDAMRNKPTYFACATSNNELQFSFPYSGGATGRLCFRNSPQFGKDVILSVDKGQFTCSFEGCSVHLKFDDGPIISVGATEAAGGDTNMIFLHGCAKLATDMRKAKHLIIEAAFFQEGEQQLQFSISGFDWKH